MGRVAGVVVGVTVVISVVVEDAVVEDGLHSLPDIFPLCLPLPPKILFHGIFPRITLELVAAVVADTVGSSFVVVYGSGVGSNSGASAEVM